VNKKKQAFTLHIQTFIICTFVPFKKTGSGFFEIVNFGTTQF